MIFNAIRTTLCTNMLTTTNEGHPYELPIRDGTPGSPVQSSLDGHFCS